MPSLSPELRERLGKLLLMLSSDHAGEQAAAAIGKALQNNGCSWHDLVGQLSVEPPPPPPPPPPHQSRLRRTTLGPDATPMVMTDDEVTRLVDAILDSGIRQSARSQELLHSLAERAARYDTVFLSTKQMQWLVDLATAARAEL